MQDDDPKRLPLSTMFCVIVVNFIKGLNISVILLAFTAKKPIFAL